MFQPHREHAAVYAVDLPLPYDLAAHAARSSFSF